MTDENTGTGDQTQEGSIDDLISGADSPDSANGSDESAHRERIEDGGTRSRQPGGMLESPSLAEYVELGTLAGLLLLGIVAAFGFYTSASTAIDRLVTAEYRPMFQAAFNLVVLLVAALGVSVVLRRRSGDNSR